MIQLGAMPLPQFLKLHPEARVTPEELLTLKTCLAPLGFASTHSDRTPCFPAAIHNSRLAIVSTARVQRPRIAPDFETWKPISTTDRGDNNTFRFILGNDIAVKAARSGSITPWPDGARFAKSHGSSSSAPTVSFIRQVHPGRAHGERRQPL